MPSRAAILTGRYPHVNGAISNHCAMGTQEITLGEYFRRAGYRCIGVGKLHIYFQKEKDGFTDTMISGGQHSDVTSLEVLGKDYKKWLKMNGYWEIVKKAYAIHGKTEYWRNFRANVNPIPKDAYIDSWVGDRAVEFIYNQSKDETFFIFIGFPNPHIPFDAPEPYASMYNPNDVPLPETFGKELLNKPPQHLGYKCKGRRKTMNNLMKNGYGK